ncbi:hypothetical protein CMUS01_13952 [Colletotrichum musicola]|uniref:Nephrocystin 3-like N-terminal domain-containing protein n=1 Tax=Colletotrichum musicola TaxID=2175873 RepID=A0A8H6J8P5_9PEZI|nr:hypothetical protein CMUS01_13952 [Colletotrichum musicola]
MEAVGAVGLAAAILQFIEFTAKLVKEGSERATIEKKHIEKLTEEIHALNIEICNGMPSNTADDAVKKLGAECMDISRELLEALAQLRARSRDTRWTSFVEALRAIWKKGEIQDLRDRLDQYRDTLHTSMLASQHNRTETLTAEVKDLRTESMNAVENLRVDLLQAIQTQKAKAPRDPDHDKTIFRCLRSLAAEESEDLRRRQRRLLAQLSFAIGHEREHQNQEPHARTFQWVWDDPKIREGCPAWSHFPSWLEGDGHKIYWITGKAASGKSNLMKCIVHDSRCDELLKRWSGGLPLVSTKFFFWGSGSEDQLSLEGFMRIILHGALSQRPDLIPKVFPERWERLLLPDSDGSPWGLGELDQAIKALARSAAGNFKLFIFVDGLDEFGGEHDALIQLYQTIVSFDNVKACLSSRPAKTPNALVMSFTDEDDTSKMVQVALKAPILPLSIEEVRHRFESQYTDWQRSSPLGGPGEDYDASPTQSLGMSSFQIESCYDIPDGEDLQWVLEMTELEAKQYRAEIIEAFIESGIDRNQLLEEQACIEGAFEEFPEISERLLKMIARKEK